MIRVLLTLGLTLVVSAEPPQQKTAAALTPSTQAEQVQPGEQKAPNSPATRRQTSLEKQRASVRKQVSGWMSIGEAQPDEAFLLPWPKPATPAANIAWKMVDPIPCDPLPEAELERIVNEAADRQKVSPRVVRAIITQESGGRPCAVSTAGAQGLMQLMPEVQRQLAVEDPFDARQSVEAGVKLLRTLIDRYAGNLPKALAAYNAGTGTVDRAGGIPPIPETTNYVAKIVQRIE